MKKAAIAAIGIAVVVGFRMSNRGDASGQTLSEMREIIQSMDEYQDNDVLLDGFLKLAHVRAFGKAYDVGGRRDSATYDQEAYLDMVFDDMIEQCQNHHKTELADALQELRKEVYLEEAQES
jgi:hypothetical protein